MVILPVNHAMDGQDVVFRTGDGSKLASVQDRDLVTFEADGYDERARSGWSVLVTGRGEPVTQDGEVRRLERMGLRTWTAPGACPFWVRIRPTSVTGRRIQEPPAITPDSMAPLG